MQVLLWSAMLLRTAHSCAFLGYYKGPASTDQAMVVTPGVPCPGYSPCPKGSYCKHNQVFPCPAGVYGNATQLSTVSCSGLCPGGFVCPVGTIEPIPCGNANVYCPVGSRATKQVPLGYYGIGDTSYTRQSIALCELGSFCVQGNMAVCLAGIFGASMGLSSAACTDVCPAGHYCPEASIVPKPCPAGTYGATTELSTSACSGVCPEGYYCPPGTTTPVACPSNYICPRGCSAPTRIPSGQYLSTVLSSDVESTLASILELCPPGSYCVQGEVIACPLGSFGATSGLTTSACSGPCPGGYYCPVGTVAPIACFDAATYCPEASSAPQPVEFGFYSLPPTRPTHQLPCEPGSYCVGGVKSACPAGSFGSSVGLTSSACSGKCPGGSYCPVGSADPVACGHSKFVCPDGAAAPQSISRGFCGIGDTILTQTSSAIAPPGSYALEGQCYICPGGYYGASSGESALTCSGLCSPGYYCPPGSTSPTQFECGLNAYCPQGSSQPIVVSPGYYTYSGATDPCPPGQYRATATSNANILLASWTAIQVNYGDELFPYAVCLPCPLGTFKLVEGDSISLCQLCPLYTTTSSTDRTTCTCFRLSGGIRWNTATDKLVFDGAVCTAVPAATLTPSLLPLNTAFTKASQFQCSRGSYCVRGQRLPCPGGRFGTQMEETSALCSGVCRRGHYCPVGSISATAQPCGGAHLYCPQGSPYPLPITLGYYSIDSVLGLDSDPTRHDAQVSCEPGYYCIHGQRFPCPGGRYGAATRETNPLCTGVCRRGFYCPASSTSATQEPCGGSNVVCRTGSVAPIGVFAGYYSGSDTTRADAVTRESMRWFQKPCEPGYYCVNGVRNPCPTGTFGSTGQLVTPFCSGKCSAGHLTSPMHESSKLPSLKVVGIEGYYCTQASTSATQIMCGDVSVFCPVGSSAPLAVDAGYYSVGATNSTRVGQALCNVGQFCRGGIAYDCPQGTYGDIPGLTVGQCTGWCAAGFYCPPRSVSATANRCADGYYSIRGQGSCMQCPSSRSTFRCQDKRECCA
ncbi:hypothetical protein, variant 1 [Aphanomyces astaci]|uniref:Tyrosine-protein kinase ephrin type A/B receptor-like domain-containing protein n=1 Tax=Aphanomyces astaci TaxID=112090 RepID=W4FJK7_APHAT|nr:hypothetical protein, variant 1 [Aphanomyces astaci]ETV67019.1 hypothetical protein, variant 1 [Aphanomyces astaci]|eukprot:XP_009843388.1 hypothetical protein, variant 1 [Aphanomyces astaci]